MATFSLFLEFKMPPGFSAASVLLAGRLVDSGCGKIVRIWLENECSKEMREKPG
jgi:hypothetical protein